MTRINTNVSALIAEQNLNNSNNMLQTTLTRLSTGLRINSAADDPAGMIAATDLGANITATNQAISNSQVASQMISTADSALSQISSLLTTINGLVTESANTASESSSQVAANQLQIDSSLNAINSIAQNTTFQGQNLLNGSLGFNTTGTSANYASSVQNLQVSQATVGSSGAPVDVAVNVTAAAMQATISNSFAAGATASADLTFADGGGMTISAPVPGTADNNFSVQFVQSASVSNAAPTASFSNNVLTVTVASTGSTSAAAIAQAIGGVNDGTAGQDFTVSNVTAGSYVAGTDLPTNVNAVATATITTDGGGSGGNLTISAKTGDSKYNGTQIVWDTSGTSVTPSASFTAGSGNSPGTLTITVDGTANTDLSAIATAINNSTDPNVSQFTASVSGSGTPVFDPDTDGPTATVGAYSTGSATIQGLNAIGGQSTMTVSLQSLNQSSAPNNVKINVVEGGTGVATTTASYNSSYNVGGAAGELTITLANNATVTSADIQNALNNIGGNTSAFTDLFATPTVSNSGGDLVTPATAGETPISASGFTSGGVDGTASTTGEITLTDGVSDLNFTVEATQWGTAANGLTVHFTNNATDANGVSAAYDSGTNTLTIDVGQNASAVTTTSLQSAFTNMGGASAFNAAYELTGVSQTGGALNGANLTSQSDVTSAGGAAGTEATNTVSVSDGTNTIHVAVAAANVNSDEQGASLNDVLVNVVEGTAGTTQTTASYNSDAGVNGELTITLANNAPVTVADIQNALANITNVNGTFANDFTATVTQAAGGAVDTPPTQAGTPLTITAGTTSGGQYNLAPMDATLSGATVSATFSGGTAAPASSAIQGALVFEVGGDDGNQQYSFAAGTTAQEIAQAVNQDSSSTGVQAAVNAQTGALDFTSTDYGSSAFVNVNVISDAGDFGSSLSSTHATGTDIQATVNNVQATGSGNTVSVDSPNLSFNMTLANGTATGTNVSFEINGGGALFQLGAVVESNQQARLGIQNVDTSNLGSGSVGYLYQLGSGQNAALSTNAALAGQIVQAALNSITSLRGQLGAFQTATLDSNISTLTNAVTNLTAAQSDIQDADFAGESASLTQQQILVQSGTTVLGIANSNPANVLTLLQKASNI